MVGPLGLRPKETPGHGPVDTPSGSVTSVLLRNPEVGRMLKHPAKSLFRARGHGEAGLQGDSITAEVPKTRSAQRSPKELPCQRIAGVHRVVLQIRNHGRDRPFDKGPSFGGRLELIPSKLPQAQVLVRHVLRKEESVKGTPVL